ncbi:MAG: hypothetical protein ACRD1B_04955 [Thermoanaerobaculia bacterium]
MGVLVPKKRAWFLASAGIGAGSLLCFAVLSFGRPWRPGRGPALWFGVAAALLVLGHAVYPLRRKLLFFPLHTAQHWAQFHVYGGVVGVLFVLIHEGFAWPSGTIGWLLLILSFWTALSGLAGVWLQKWIPALMASGLGVEAIFERIPELIDELRAEAGKLVEGSSEIFERFYRDDVEPALAGVDVSWDYLLDVRRGRDRRLAPFVRLAAHLPETERPRLEDLKSLFTEKLELDAQCSLQRILRAWLQLHVPPAMLLVGIMLFHIGSNLLYGLP